MTAISAYLKKIDQAFSVGNATEHTHRPALKELLESLADGVVATNEPRRVQCGAPDFIITKGQSPLGYVECKDIGKSLAEVERSEQLRRYRESLGNLILTDYLEFRWYVGGQYRNTVQLATITDNKIKPAKNAAVELSELLKAFFMVSISTVNSPKELALRMAGQARLIRDIIQIAFNEEALTDEEPDPLHEQLEGFRKVLIHDLQPDQFADMYAQTICYGLFAARCNSPSAERFTRQTAGFALPKTNPFLRKMFDYIAGINLDDRIVWAVDDLADLLHHTDMEAILKDFGKRTRQEDPVVHFYESFLAAYDSRMREARGVYYTPEPVVSYIVRSIDHILKKDFKLKDGLADASTVKVDNPTGQRRKKNVHKVQILDPATGTGTFLYSVIDHINERFKNDRGMWSSYVSQHLLPRLFGFELLMAPYAVAHMKLGLQLRESGYDFLSSERLRIYLTNTLEEAHAMTGLPLFTQWIAEEANAASDIKKDAPVMVVLGNPPYSYSSENKGKWITSLIRDYYQVDGAPLRERNPKGLQDDYVKFIRFAQWRIEQTGYGILAFISNNGYLDNPTFRGMRQNLMQTFDDIYILDLHGNSKKKEVCPNGSEDNNVFDIMQGVAIGIFVKRKKSKEEVTNVYHAELWGKREEHERDNQQGYKLIGGKYHWLWENELSSTKWHRIKPTAPSYLFTNTDDHFHNEYHNYYSIKEIMSVNSGGMNTARDNIVIDIDESVVISRIKFITDKTLSPKDVCDSLGLKSTPWWKAVDAVESIRKIGYVHNQIIPCLYKPFDFRFLFYNASFIDRPRTEVNRHILKGSLSIITSRQTKEQFGVLASNLVCGQHKIVTVYDRSYFFPLYLYPSNSPNDTLFNTNTTTATTRHREPNFSNRFIKDFERILSLRFIVDGKGDRTSTFGPEDIFSYMYAVFHSPTYRSRYATLLKSDFPRLPVTSNQDLFRSLCSFGDDLVALHLMENHGPKMTTYPIAGDSTVESVRYTEQQSDSKGRVWINKTQYFEGVPEGVWKFHIGGYQVCHKWLKDRKGRKLTYDDLTRYQHIVSALSETIRLMEQIDETINNSGGWPFS